LRHELEHFKIESFALNAEMFLGKAIYTPYLTNIYAETYYTDGCLEEALANATVLNSTVIKNLFDKELYPSADEKKRRVPWQVIVMEEFFDHQPAGYRNYSLTSGWPYEKDTHLHFDYRRRAMNFLCNQIVSGKVNPPKDEIPFYAFLPDNHFLRAENLVPIHIVKSLSDDESFIHVATPKRKVWERFLNGLGYVPTKRGSGDHVVWSRPGLPDLTINYHGDVLDFNSFKSSLKNLGININAFRNYQNTGRLPPVLLERLQAAKIVAG